MKTPNPSDSNWHWAHFLGAAPDRAQGRYTQYKKTEGLESIGHLAMAVFWSVPVVGGAVSLIGRVCYLASGKEDCYRALPTEEQNSSNCVFEKSKEIQKGFIESLTEKGSYYCSTETINKADFLRKRSPLHMDVTLATSQSKQNTIENAICFDIEINSKLNPGIKGRVLRISNELRSSTSANENQGNFKMKFVGDLIGSTNIAKAIEKNISTLENEVMCYIDETTNIAHVGTVGDSQACIVRKIDGKEKIIPLSIPSKTVVNDKNQKNNMSYVAFPIEKGDVLILNYTSIDEEKRIEIALNKKGLSEMAENLVSQSNRESNTQAIVVRISRKK